MKTLNLVLIATAAFGLGLTGCSKAEPQPAGTPPEKGTVQTAVEGFTGKTYVDAGLRAKEQVKQASEKEQRDRDEALQ